MPRRGDGAQETLHKSKWALQKRNDEVADLQRALSDSHVFLWDEREKLQKLQAENDEFKIQELEDRRRIQHLLSLVEPVTQDVTYQRSVPPDTLTVKPHARATTSAAPAGAAQSNRGGPVAVGKGGGHGDGEGSRVLRTIYMPNEKVDSLLLTIESLRTQMQEQERLSRERIAALLEDRRRAHGRRRHSERRGARPSSDPPSPPHHHHGHLHVALARARTIYVALTHERVHVADYASPRRTRGRARRPSSCMKRRSGSRRRNRCSTSARDSHPQTRGLPASCGRTAAMYFMYFMVQVHARLPQAEARVARAAARRRRAHRITPRGRVERAAGARRPAARRGARSERGAGGREASDRAVHRAVPPAGISAASRLYLGCISAVSRLYLGCISGVSWMYLGCTSAVSRLHLGCISGASRPRIGCISGIHLGRISGVCRVYISVVSRQARELRKISMNASANGDAEVAAA